MFQKIFCRVFLWSHNFLLQVSPPVSHVPIMCANNEMFSNFTTKFCIQNVTLFLVMKYEYSIQYTHIFFIFLFLFDIYLINILHFPYIITLAIILLMFLHNRFIVQRTSGSLLFFIQIYDIIIFWSITHYKRTMIMYVSSPSVLGEPGEAV